MLSRNWPRSAGIVVTLATAVLLAADLARLTTASSFAESRPELASRLAPASPAALASTAMEQIGEAAVHGQEPSADTLQRLQRLATTAPLAPEPFLVEAALAERAADYGRAERLLDAALARAPRSAAAHYLLADVRLRAGKVSGALRELAILAKVFPGTSLQLVSGLAEYARSPEARAGLGSVITENSQMKGPLLNALAADPANADLIVDLFQIGPNGPESETIGWQSRLLEGFIRRGDYDGAYAYWRRFAGLSGGERPLLFDGGFTSPHAPPPFNWTLASGSAGVAERDAGKLRVLYYGREEAVLAWQLLLLPPGTYRFTAAVTGTAAPNSLGWTLACAPAGPLLMNLDVAGSTSAGTLTVPASCQAQVLQLLGHTQDMPKDSDVRIGPVAIVSTGP